MASLSSVATTETATSDASTLSLKLPASGYRMKLDGTDPKFGDWRDDLVRDGYVVVKGAIPRERAMQYADKMYSLLESLYVEPCRRSRLTCQA